MQVKPLQPPFRPSDDAIRAFFKSKGWPSPETTGRPVIVGFRQPADPGEWNDIVGVWLPDGRMFFFRGTTEPGRRSIEKFKNSKGCTRLLPGYHRDFFKFHFHHYDRKHPCLGQAVAAPCEKFFADRGWVHIGADRIRYLNLHRARYTGGVPDKIGGYSEGCTVIPDRLEHWFVMDAIGFPSGQSIKWVSGSYEFLPADAATRFDYALIDVSVDDIAFAA